MKKLLYFFILCSFFSCSLEEKDCNCTVEDSLTTVEDSLISVADVSISEKDATGNFTLSLSEASKKEITVNYEITAGTATEGDDYTINSGDSTGTVTFAVGETSKEIAITVVLDTTEEESETLTITLSNPTNATLETATATMTITDTDAPSLSISDTTVSETAGTSTITISLSEASIYEVKVTLSTSAGTATAATDYTETSSTATIAIGETSATVSIPILDDTDFDVNETVTLTLSNAENATILNATATLTIENDDVKIFAGGDTTCIINGSGKIKCWGEGDQGQLGNASTSNTNTPPSDYISLDDDQYAVDLSVGAHHICALMDNQKIKCWGQGTDGQLGYGDANNRGDDADEMGDNLPYVDLGTGIKVAQIESGAHATCALTTEGQVKCWGDGWAGSLGNGGNDKIGDNSGEMGDNLNAVNLPVAGSKVTYISMVGRTTGGILEDTTLGLILWGLNDKGQLANENDTNTNTPTASITFTQNITQIVSSETHICALLEDGTVKCWGGVNMGQLGNSWNIGNTMDNLGDAGGEAHHLDESDSTVIGVTAKSLSRARESYSCALLTNNTVKCWGKNDNGQLGQGNTNNIGDSAGEMSGLSAIDLGSSDTLISLVSGNHHNCVLFSDKTMKCWGRNTEGQLGNGANANIGDEASEMGSNLPSITID